MSRRTTAEEERTPLRQTTYTTGLGPTTSHGADPQSRRRSLRPPAARPRPDGRLFRPTLEDDIECGAGPHQHAPASHKIDERKNEGSRLGMEEKDPNETSRQQLTSRDNG